jgi:hypothetical protein
MRGERAKTLEPHLVLGWPHAAIVWQADEIEAGLVVRAPELEKATRRATRSKRLWESVSYRMRTWNATMARTERVMMIATRLADASSRASGISSEKTIQIIAPAANPSP